MCRSVEERIETVPRIGGETAVDDIGAGIAMDQIGELVAGEVASERRLPLHRPGRAMCASLGIAADRVRCVNG